MPEGYATYRLRDKWEDGLPQGSVVVVEAIGTSLVATREIWRYLFGIDLRERVEHSFVDPALTLYLGVADPRRLRLKLTDGLWLRLIDVAAALRARAWGSGRLARPRGPRRVLPVERRPLPHRRREGRRRSRSRAHAPPISRRPISAASTCTRSLRPDGSRSARTARSRGRRRCSARRCRRTARRSSNSFFMPTRENLNSMSRDSGVVGVALVGLAVAVGSVGDLLFHGRPLGLNVLLFAVCFVAALALLLRIGRAPLHQGRRWMAAPLLVFSAAFLWHDSPLLTAANLIAIAGAVSLGALRRTRSSPSRAGVADFAAAIASAGAGTVAGAVHLLNTRSRGRRRREWCVDAEPRRSVVGSRSGSLGRIVRRLVHRGGRRVQEPRHVGRARPFPSLVALLNGHIPMEPTAIPPT